MFSSIVSKFLIKYLSEYIENISSDNNNLHLSIINGYVKLNNLIIKQNVLSLNGFNLPFEITKGYLEGLLIEIPWRSLEKDCIVIKINGLYLLCQPKKNCYCYSNKEHKRKVKENRLNIYEKEEEDDEKVSWTSFLFNKIIKPEFIDSILNNIQIIITNIHLRYEDKDNNIVFGMILESLSIDSCNELWEKMFIEMSNIGKYICKICELKNLSIYMNSLNDKWIFFSNNNDHNKEKEKEEEQSMENFVKRMKEFTNNINEMKVKYLMKPVNDCKVKVKFQKEGEIDLTLPKMYFDVEIGKVEFNLDDYQIKSLLNITDYISNYEIYDKYRMFKPLKSPKEDNAKEWWKYLLKSAKKEIISGKLFTFSELTERRKTKNKYINLFKKTKNLSWIGNFKDEEESEFKHLEEILSYEDIVYFRNLAYKEIEIEKLHVKRESNKKRKSWKDWIPSIPFIDFNNSVKVVSLSHDEEIELSNKIKEYVLIDQSKNPSTTLPDKFIKLEFTFVLKSTSIVLIDSKEGQSILNMDILNLETHVKMSKEMNIVLSLFDFKAHNLYSKNTLFKKFITRRNVEDGKELAKINIIVDPINGREDLYCKMELNLLDIAVDFKFFQKVISLFSVLVTPTVNLKMVEETTMNQLNKIQQLSQTQLQLALENKKVVNLDVRVKAPRYFFPSNCFSENSSMILFNLGELKIVSSSDKNERKRIARMNELKEEDYYDEFVLSLKDFEIILTNFETWKSGKVMDEPSSSTLIEKVGLNLFLKRCIIPLSIERIQFIVQGKIPIFKFNISPKKLEELMLLVNNLYQFLDNPVGKGTSIQEGNMSVKISRLIKNGDDEEIVIQEDAKYFVQLRLNGYLYLFDPKDKDNKFVTPQSKICLDSNIKVTEIDGVSLKRGIVLVIPQENKEHLKVILNPECDTALWINSINEIMLKFQSAVKNDGENVVQKVNEIEDSQVAKEAKLVEFSFELKRFEVEMEYDYKSVNSLPVARFLFDDLKMCFTDRKYDQKLFVKLKSIAVEDLVDPTTDFIFQTSNKDVFSMEYVNSSNKESNLYSDKGDTVVNVNFKEFTFVVDPRTLSHFVRMIYGIQNVMNGLKSRTIVYYSLEDKEEDQKLMKNEDRNTMYVKAIIEKSNLKLVDYGRNFSDAAMQKLEVIFCSSPSKTKIKGNVDCLSVKDDYNHQILETKNDDSFIRFNFVMFNNILCDDKELPVFDKSFELSICSIKFLLIMSWIRKLKNYFSEGSLMEALQTQSKIAAQKTIEVVKEQTKSIKLIKMKIKLSDIRIVLPISHYYNSGFEGHLGSVKISNSVKEESNEEFMIVLSDMGVSTIDDKNDNIFKQGNINIMFQRSLENDTIKTHIKFDDLKISLSHDDYKQMFQVLDNNISDPESEVDALRICEEEEEEERKLVEEKKKNTTKKVGKNLEMIEIVKMEVLLEIPNISLKIIDGEMNDLAQLELKNLGINMKNTRETSQYILSIGSLTGFDRRKNVKNVFKEFISTPKSSVYDYEHENVLDLIMNVDEKEKTKISVQFKSPKIYVFPELFLDVNYFFTEQYDNDKNKRRSKKNIKMMKIQKDSLDTEKNIVLTCSTWLTYDIFLSSDRKLIIKGDGKNIVIEGEGKCITLDTVNDDERLIIIEKEVKKVTFKNVLFKTYDFDSFKDMKMFDFSDNICQNVYTSSIDGCHAIEIKRTKEVDSIIQDEKISKVKETEKQPIMPSGIITSIEINGNVDLFLPSDVSNLDCKQFKVSLSLFMEYLVDDKHEKGILTIDDLVVNGFSNTTQAMEHIIDPAKVVIEMFREFKKNNLLAVTRNFYIDFQTNFNIRIAYQDVKVMKVIMDNLLEKLNSKKNKVGNVELNPIKVSSIKEIIEEVNECSEEENSEDDISSEEEEDEYEDANEFFYEKKGEESDDKIAVESLLSSTQKKNEVVKQKFSLFLQTGCNTFYLLFVDDIRGFDIPLLLLQFGNIESTSEIYLEKLHEISLILTLSLSIQNYNLKFAEWEPLLEKCSCKMEYLKHVVYPDDEEDPYTQKITLENCDKSNVNLLNITVTQRMLETLKRTQKLIEDDYSKNSTEIVSLKFDPFTIRNHSGFDVKCWKEKSNNHLVIKSGTSLGLKFDYDQRNFKEGLFVFFKISDFPTKRIDLKKAHVSITKKKDNSVMCITIELLDGRRIITVRSGILIENCTNVNWNIGVYLNNIIVREIAVIKKGETCGIPINFVELGILTIKPVTTTSEKDFAWSKKLNNLSFVEMKASRKIRVLSCSSNIDSSKFYGVIEISNNVSYKETSQSSVDISKHLRTSNKKLIPKFKECITMKIKSPFVIENVLGIDIDVDLFETVTLKNSIKKTGMKIGSMKLARGECCEFYETNLKKDIHMNISSISGNGFITKENSLIYSNKYPKIVGENIPKEFILIQDEHGNDLKINIEYESSSSSAYRKIILYCSYWIVNHTYKNIICWFKNNKRDEVLPGQGISKSKIVESLFYISDPNFVQKDFLIESTFRQKRYITLPGEPKTDMNLSVLPLVKNSTGKGQRWVFDGKHILSYHHPIICLESRGKNLVTNILDLQRKVQEWKWENNTFVNNNGSVFHKGGKIDRIKLKKTGRIRRKRYNAKQSWRLISGDRYFKCEKKHLVTTATTIVEKAKVPLLFTFPMSLEKKHKQISITVNKSNMSDSFQIDNVGFPSTVGLASEGRKYEIAISVSVAAGKFKRTKIITFQSRYIIVNISKQNIICFRQYDEKEDTKTFQEILPSERKNFYWSDVFKSFLLQIKTRDSLWSKPVDISRSDLQHMIDLSSPIKKGKRYFFTLTMKICEGSIFVCIEDRETSPFEIHNKLKEEDIFISQTGSSNHMTVKQNSKVKFYWDDLKKPQSVDVLVPQKTKNINNQKMIEESEEEEEGYYCNYVYILKNYVFSSQQKGKLFVKGHDGKSYRTYSNIIGPKKILVIEEAGTKNKKSQKISMTVSLKFSEIGISLINATPIEIIYITFIGVKMDIVNTNLKILYDFKLKGFQIDDQSSEKALYPVVLSHNYDESNKNPIIQFKMRQLIEEEEENNNFFELFSLILREFNLEIDFSLLLKIHDCISLFTDYDDEEESKKEENDLNKMIQEIKEPIIIEDDNVSKYYFESFGINEINMNFTFKFSKQSDKKSPLFLMLDHIGFTILNCENTSLNFNEFKLKNPYLSVNDLIDKIKHHYIRQTLNELYKIIGSLNIVGNPYGLVSDISSGFKDVAISMKLKKGKNDDESPKTIVEGVGSLVKKSTHGVANSTSKVANSISKGTGLLTFDPEYVKEQEEISSKKANNVAQGIYQGGEQFVKSIFGGIKGVVMAPVKEVKQKGAKGVVKGIGKGLLGLTAKPISGFFQAISKLSEGISSVGGRTTFKRRRNIRSFREDGLVIPFDPLQSFIKLLLSRLNDKKAHKDIGKETGRYFIELENSTVLVLTTNSMLLISVKNISLIWRIIIHKIVKTEFASGCLKLFFSTPENKKKKVDVKEITYVQSSVLERHFKKLQKLLEVEIQKISMNRDKMIKKIVYMRYKMESIINKLFNKNKTIVNNSEEGILIGNGSFGSVYKVAGKDGRTVAIKKISKKIVKVIFSEFWELEYIFTNNIYHNNILAIHGFEETETHYNIVSEYAQFQFSRFFYSNFGSNSTNDASVPLIMKMTFGLPFFYSILNGLCYLHSKNIFHQNLKPSNILILNGCVKISDYGYTKIFTRNFTKINKTLSMKYFAPELITAITENKRVLLNGEKLDIWSLGITFLELILGKYPFEDKNEEKLIHYLKNLKENIEIEKIIPRFEEIKKHPKFGIIISNCLKINPKERLSVYELLKL